MIRIRIWTSDQYYSKGQGIMSLDKDQDQGEDRGLGSGPLISPRIWIRVSDHDQDNFEKL